MKLICADLWAKRFVKELEQPSVFDGVMRRDRMRQATVDAIGAWRAEPLFLARPIHICRIAPNGQSVEKRGDMPDPVTQGSNG
jgi:hypothetical protein